MRPLWLKWMLIAAPFVGVTIDVLGWYATKVFPPFAWGVLIAGVINGVSFAAMWAISMYQMWIYKVPEHVRRRRPDELDS